MSRNITHYVVTANTTDEGAPVYLREDGSWTEVLSEAAIVDEARAQELVRESSKREREVCDPYSFGVRMENGRVDPMSTREAIRCQGPTTRVRRPDGA